jgi:hypothetical protein
MDSGDFTSGGKANPKASLKKAQQAMFTVEGCAAGLDAATSAASEPGPTGDAGRGPGWRSGSEGVYDGCFNGKTKSQAGSSYFSTTSISASL